MDLFFLSPLLMFWLHSSLRERSWRRQQRTGALLWYTYTLLILFVATEGSLLAPPLHIRPCLRRTLVSNTGHVLRWGHDTIL